MPLCVVRWEMYVLQKKNLFLQVGDTPRLGGREKMEVLIPHMCKLSHLMMLSRGYPAYKAKTLRQGELRCLLLSSVYSELTVLLRVISTLVLRLLSLEKLCLVNGSSIWLMKNYLRAQYLISFLPLGCWNLIGMAPHMFRLLLVTALPDNLRHRLQFLFVMKRIPLGIKIGFSRI